MGNILQKSLQIPPPQHSDELQQQLLQQEDEFQQQQQDEEENQEFTCQICIEPMLIPEKKFKNTNKCSHPFCTDCIIEYIRARLEYNNVGTIDCPATNCEHTLDPRACASITGSSLFVRWCDVLCEESIVDLDKCYCPYRNCSEVIVNECGGNVKKSDCPNCRRSICFECKSVWHAGFRCEESGEEMDSNDVAFGRLVEEKKWMRCPQCRHFVELKGGCLAVTCRCLMKFCYYCGEQFRGYGCRCNNTLMLVRIPVITYIFFFIGLIFWAWKISEGHQLFTKFVMVLV